MDDIGMDGHQSALAHGLIRDFQRAVKSKHGLGPTPKAWEEPRFRIGLYDPDGKPTRQMAVVTITVAPDPIWIRELESGSEWAPEQIEP